VAGTAGSCFPLTRTFSTLGARGNSSSTPDDSPSLACTLALPRTRFALDVTLASATRARFAWAWTGFVLAVVSGKSSESSDPSASLCSSSLAGFCAARVALVGLSLISTLNSTNETSSESSSEGSNEDSSNESSTSETNSETNSEGSNSESEQQPAVRAAAMGAAVTAPARAAPVAASMKATVTAALVAAPVTTAQVAVPAVTAAATMWRNSARMQRDGSHRIAISASQSHQGTGTHTRHRWQQRK